jgi:hypothetical protein
MPLRHNACIVGIPQGSMYDTNISVRMHSPWALVISLDAPNILAGLATDCAPFFSEAAMTSSIHAGGDECRIAAA